MSDQSSTTRKRAYRKRLRADQEADTRRRITEATVDLHGSVGPARTTVSAVAERAGVQRATVYRHFPDEQSLFAACSAHWAALNPPPDPARWLEIADPDERLRTALEELYSWYVGTEDMLENTSRDLPLVPAMAKAAQEFGRWYDVAARALMRGRPERGARRRRVGVAIGHALAFDTWRSLVRDQGLKPDEAVALMAGLAAAA
ncbi:MAG: TetR/AcrR family transcriptional regulator [Solirubrobacterales bacterium]